MLTIQVPASALQENQLHQALTATPIITSIMSLPPALASSVLQQHVNAVLQNNSMQAIAMQKQLDGAADTSEEEGSEVSDDNLDNDDDDADKDDDEDLADIGAEEEPLNSDDDVSEEEQADLFDTDNVVVCQYDKVNKNFKLDVHKVHIFLEKLEKKNREKINKKSVISVQKKTNFVSNLRRILAAIVSREIHRFISTNDIISTLKGSACKSKTKTHANSHFFIFNISAPQSLRLFSDQTFFFECVF